MTTLSEATEMMRAAVGDDSGLGKSIKYDFQGEGFIHIDGGSVTNDDAPADLTMTMSFNDFLALGKGELDPMSAVMSGRLKLSDMMAAMALQPKLNALMARVPKS
jgi:putative sterol carrier protein